MNLSILIRLVGLLVGAGLFTTFLTVTNGVFLIKQGNLLTVLVGVVEILRWSLAAIAAILLIMVRAEAKWILLGSFVIGFFASWVSFIPFGGYLMNLVSSEFTIPYLFVLQGLNLLVVVLVFYLFKSKDGRRRAIE